MKLVSFQSVYKYRCLFLYTPTHICEQYCFVDTIYKRIYSVVYCMHRNNSRECVVRNYTVPGAALCQSSQCFYVAGTVLTPFLGNQGAQRGTLGHIATKWWG